MKKLLFVSTLLAAGLVQAAEVTVVDQVMQISQYDSVKSQFNVDSAKDTATVRMEVSILTGVDNGGPEGRKEVYNLEVPGLEVSNGKLILNTTEGAVACATLGKTRVLNRPVLRFTGKCHLETAVSTYLDGRRVVVKIVTK
ncbi:MAG: hypothetical protein ACJ76H_15420 [Bacteriovoracaceae bacterium]